MRRRGFLKGHAFARNVPLSRLLLVLFLAKQEKYISSGCNNLHFINKYEHETNKIGQLDL